MFPKIYKSIEKGWKQGLVLSDKPKEKKIPKQIPKISEKKKKILKEEGSEVDLFKSIIEKRGSLYCEECGKHLPNPKPHNFDHVKGKGMNKELRLDESNIMVLCFAHHFKKTTGLEYKGINLD